MSRSRRKNPFCGITTAKSDKINKQKANRRLRLKVKNALKKGKFAKITRNEVSSPWEFAKDGKQRIDIDSKIMRK